MLLCMAVSVLVLAGCGEQIVSECDCPKESGAMRATFTDIEQQVFAQSCAVAGCHAAPNPQAGLLLTSTAAYDAIVGVESRTNPGRKLVDPGNPDASILVLALRRSIMPNMPPAGPLPQPVVDSVAAWIAAGAPRN